MPTPTTNTRLLGLVVMMNEKQRRTRNQHGERHSQGARSASEIPTPQAIDTNHHTAFLTLQHSVAGGSSTGKCIDPLPCLGCTSARFCFRLPAVLSVAW